MKEIKDRLVDLALKFTTPFCYQCYVKAPANVCPECHSDDLMRHLSCVGVEYGTEWVIEHLLKENLEPVDIKEHFKEHIRACYPEEVKVAWLTLDVVDVLKTYDETAWDIAESDYLDGLEEDGEVFTFDNGLTHYWTHDLERFLEESAVDEPITGT